MNLPDFYGTFTQARQNGAQRADDYTVRQNLGGALQGESGALAAILKASPQMGVQLQERQAGQKQAQLEQLGKFASAYVQTRDPMIWKQMHPLMVQAGAPADMPADLATPEDFDGSLKAAQSFAAMYGNQQAQEQFTLSPGSARYDASGRQIAAQPFQNKPDFQLYESADGPMWLPKPTQGGMPQQTAGGPMGGAAGQVMGDAYNGTVDPVRDFPTFASMPGVQVSSLYRDPAHNAKVGGVPNSYHPKGQAGDFVVPPEQRAAFIAQARSMGYDAIDEGDHVHLEPSRGARATSQYSAGQGVGAIPIAGVRPKPKTAGSEIERRIELAREAGATPDEIKRMVIGREGAAAGAKPVPVGALKELLAIEDSLGSTKLVADTLARHAAKLQSGELSVTPVNAAGAFVREKLGVASEKDTNLREFKSDITRTVNEWLRMNKGVQTEGDAQREYKAIMDSNDPVVVARSVQRLAGIMKNTVAIQVRKRDAINRNYGNSTGAPAQQPAQAPAQQPVKRARNPQTGETLVLINGQWVPE